MDKDTVIHYVEIDKKDASIYDEIEMKVRVKEIYEVNGNGVDDITFQKYHHIQKILQKTLIIKDGKGSLI